MPCPGTGRAWTEASDTPEPVLVTRKDSLERGGRPPGARGRRAPRGEAGGVAWAADPPAAAVRRRQHVRRDAVRWAAADVGVEVDGLGFEALAVGRCGGRRRGAQLRPVAYHPPAYPRHTEHVFGHTS